MWIPHRHVLSREGIGDVGGCTPTAGPSALSLEPNNLRQYRRAWVNIHVSACGADSITVVSVVGLTRTQESALLAGGYM